MFTLWICLVVRLSILGGCFTTYLPLWLPAVWESYFCFWYLACEQSVHLGALGHDFLQFGNLTLLLVLGLWTICALGCIWAWLPAVLGILLLLLVHGLWTCVLGLWNLCTWAIYFGCNMVLCILLVCNVHLDKKGDDDWFYNRKDGKVIFLSLCNLHIRA